MSMIYDNWERLVAGVLKREQIWQLCHEHSRSPSLSSESSESSPSFRSTDDDDSDEKPVAKLVFLGCSEPGYFRLKPTLKGLRELGKGRFRTTLLTQLSSDVNVSGEGLLEKGTKMAAKLLRDEVKVTEEKLQMFMMVFQGCRHQNVGPPKAYYFSSKPNGTLIVYDYHTLGSVSEMLRGKKHVASWERRVRIAMGAARGVAHIHEQCDGKLAHGNIKSSNIFLNSDYHACVSDFGVASFFIRPWNFCQQRDLYMFGLLLLDLLTGKSCDDGGFGSDAALLSWVRSIKYEDFCLKLFDPSLEYNEEDRLEMVEVVCIAMRCVQECITFKMCDVLLMLENSIAKPYKIWGSWI